MKLTQQHIKKIQNYFAKQKDISAVYLYGSFAKGVPHKRSDIDFGVLFEEKVNLYKRLGQIYSDLYDFKLPAEPEVREITLNDSPVFLMNVIAGKLIYTSQNLARIRFEVAVLNEFYDTKMLRDIKYLYMDKRLKEGTYGY